MTVPPYDVSRQGGKTTFPPEVKARNRGKMTVPAYHELEGVGKTTFPSYGEPLVFFARFLPRNGLMAKADSCSLSGP